MNATVAVNGHHSVLPSATVAIPHNTTIKPQNLKTSVATSSNASNNVSESKSTVAPIAFKLQLYKQHQIDAGSYSNGISTNALGGGDSATHKRDRDDDEIRLIRGPSKRQKLDHPIPSSENAKLSITGYPPRSIPYTPSISSAAPNSTPLSTRTGNRPQIPPASTIPPTSSSTPSVPSTSSTTTEPNKNIKSEPTKETSPSPEAATLNVVNETDLFARSIWASHTPSSLFNSSELYIYMTTKEKRELHARQGSFSVRRQREKERIASLNQVNPQNPSPSSAVPFATRLHDVQFSLHLPHKAHNVSTFRGACALDQTPLINEPRGLILSFYQHGFTVSTDNGNGGGWQPWDHEHAVWLAAVDRGEIPSFFNVLANQYQLSFIDGNILVEIRDYRNIGGNVKEPSVTRILIRPTDEVIAADAHFILHQYNSGLATVSEASMQVESALMRLVRPSLCLNPSIRVAQILGLCWYNLRLGNVPPLDRDEAECRLDELHTSLNEYLFGFKDQPVVEKAEADLEIQSTKPSALLQRFTNLSTFVRENLERRVHTETWSDSRPLAWNELLRYDGKMADIEDDEELMPLINNKNLPRLPKLLPNMSDFNAGWSGVVELLAKVFPYASYVHNAEESRRAFSQSVSLTDPALRKTILSGSAAQMVRFEQLKSRAFSLKDPVTVKPPITIDGYGKDLHGHPANFAKNFKRQEAAPGAWYNWTFYSPIPAGSSGNHRLVTELALYARPINVHAGRGERTNFSWSGRYECQIRSYRTGSLDESDKILSFSIGGESAKDAFISAFIRELTDVQKMELKPGSPVISIAAPFLAPTDTTVEERSVPPVLPTNASTTSTATTASAPAAAASGTPTPSTSTLGLRPAATSASPTLRPNASVSAQAATPSSTPSNFPATTSSTGYPSIMPPQNRIPATSSAMPAPQQQRRREDPSVAPSPRYTAPPVIPGNGVQPMNYYPSNQSSNVPVRNSTANAPPTHNSANPSTPVTANSAAQSISQPSYPSSASISYHPTPASRIPSGTLHASSLAPNISTLPSQASSMPVDTRTASIPPQRAHQAYPSIPSNPQSYNRNVNRDTTYGPGVIPPSTNPATSYSPRGYTAPIHPSHASSPPQSSSIPPPQSPQSYPALPPYSQQISQASVNYNAPVMPERQMDPSYASQPNLGYPTSRPAPYVYPHPQAAISTGAPPNAYPTSRPQGNDAASTMTPEQYMAYMSRSARSVHANPS